MQSETLTQDLSRRLLTKPPSLPKMLSCYANLDGSYFEKELIDEEFSIVTGHFGHDSCSHGSC